MIDQSPPTEAIEAFHRHLDRCEQCRDRPFELCAVGQPLLLAAANQDQLGPQPPPNPYNHEECLLAAVGWLILNRKRFIAG
jgi:hypothetical protein